MNLMFIIISEIVEHKEFQDILSLLTAFLNIKPSPFASWECDKFFCCDILSFNSIDYKKKLDENLRRLKWRSLSNWQSSWILIETMQKQKKKEKKNGKEKEKEQKRKKEKTTVYIFFTIVLMYFWYRHVVITNTWLIFCYSYDYSAWILQVTDLSFFTEKRGIKTFKSHNVNVSIIIFLIKKDEA